MMSASNGLVQNRLAHQIQTNTQLSLEVMCLDGGQDYFEEIHLVMVE